MPSRPSLGFVSEVVPLALFGVAQGGGERTYAPGATPTLLLNFEDLDPAPSSYDVMPEPYAGFTFTNWFYGVEVQYTPASGVIDLFTEFADPSDPGAFIISNNNAISRSQGFIFEGAWFSGYSGVTFQFWFNGALVHTSASLPNASGQEPYGPTYLGGSYTGIIDTVVVSGVQGYFAMDDFTYRLQDDISPLAVGFSPLDAGIGVPISSNVVVTFSEFIQRGTGSIVLRTAAGAVVATYDAATSANLSISGSTLTVNPAANLAYDTHYFLEFAAGSVKDLIGNDFAGTVSYDFFTRPTPTRSDNFVVTQHASPAILGSGPGDDTYLVSPSLLPDGTSLTLSDTIGSNSIQFGTGLAVASTKVGADALQLTLANGSVITLLGAAAFGFDVAANSSAGIDGPDLSYASFAQQVLGVVVPTGSGLNTGGAVVIGGGAGLPAFPAGAKSDDFVVAQYASPAILGAGTGDDTYLLSPHMLIAGTQLTISDTVGSNSVQLADGLDIASSRVAPGALQLTLVNGSVITVLGAADFGFDAGGNRSTGIDGADLSYAAFALQVLGVAVPASGIAVGGPVLIGATGQAGTITVPVGSMAPLTAAAGADVVAFDVGAARATTAHSQIDISGFATASDRLRLDLPLASGTSNLASLDGQQGVPVEFDPFASATVVNFGPDAGGNIVALSLLGVTDAALVQVEVF